jgi:putative SOS response-associated peptidase YedK
MCGRFTLFDTDALYSRFRVWLPDDIKKKIKPRYNIAPSQYVPIIYQNKEQENSLEMMRWGLVPFWTNDPKIGFKLINARVENLSVKPSFKYSLKSKRCLVPSTGFFEWKKTGKDKIPYYIGLENGELFAFAGLYDIWKDVEGKEHKTFTIITTEPNNILRPIHNRMPVILQREFEGLWLDSTVQDSTTLIQMLKPFPDDDMKAYIVSKEVNNPANDNPHIIRKEQHLTMN